MKNYGAYFIFFCGLLFLLLLPVRAMAQNCEKPFKLGPICGKIIDYDTGLPIAGAQIIGDPTCPVSTTNSNVQGVYCLNLNCCSSCQNFPAIRYNNFVTVKASGYCLMRTRPVFGHIDSVNFYLSRNCNCSRPADSLVLVQMSNALNLNWPITTPLSNSQAWGGGSPGMFFSENLCVTGINMKPGYGVIPNGILPTAAFSTLTGLEEFDSEGDGTRFLSGTLPDMTNFKNLNYFRLRKSKITGGVPASFGKLRNLTTFVVIQNPELRGIIPPQMGNMRELGVFHLYENNLTGTIPTELGNLKKLYEFDIHTNNLSGTLPTGFGTCDSLRHFFVDDCGLTGRDAQIDFMFRLPKIQYLGLSGNKFTGTIPKVPAAPVNYNLSFINLNNNQFDSLPPLSSQRFYLSVKNNKLTFDDLLPNMTYLNSAGQNCVTDEQYAIGGYAPQDSIGTEKTIIATVGSTITIDELKIDGAITDNSYQWFKNGVAYGSPLRSNKLIIPNFPASDTGTYVCRVTNPRAPLLTLNSRKITIKIQACTINAPTIGPIAQPSCTLSAGRVVLVGLPSTGTWTLTRNPSGVTTTGTGANTLVNGVPSGTYTYTVTNAAGCTSVPTPTIVINTAPSIPSTPSVGTISQPTCTILTGSVVLNGLPTGTWTLTRNPDGVTTTGTGASTTITGLAAGTYTYTVTNNVTCTSASTIGFTINKDGGGTPSTPSVGTITQPTCTVATGNVVLTGLPNAGTWTLTRSPDGVTTTGTGTTTTIMGVAAGIYTYTVTNATGCVSSPTENIVFNANAGNPSTPSVNTLTQPTCTVSTGSVVLNGLPNTGTWTLTRSPNNVTITGTGTSTTISGLGVGTYTYTVTNTSGCTSAPTGNIVINPNTNTQSTPSVGTLTQPTCTVSTGSVVLNDLPSTGTWTLTRSPDGVTTIGTGASTTIAGLSAGTFTYTVTNGIGCTSLPTANVVITSFIGNPSAPSVGAVTQPTCTVLTGSVVINGLPNTGIWSLTRNPDGVTTTGTGASTTITGLSAGTYTYTVTNGTGCASSPTANIAINPNIGNSSTPSVGTLTQPTCSVATGIVILNSLPSTGTWTLTRNDGTTITGTGESTTITGLSAGTYTYTLTNISGCTSSPTANIVINPSTGNPSTPSVGTLTQPTCSVATGSVVLNGLPNTGTWTLTRNDGTTITGTGESTTVTGLSAGTYTYTLTNISGCTSSPTANIVINPSTGNPSTPSVGTLTQPTCSVATGSVVLNGLPNIGTWTLTRNDGTTITGTGESTTISGLSAGTYTYTLTNVSGCTSSPTANIVINPSAGNPSTPSVGTLTQPTCSVATGSVVINGLPSTGTWTLTRNDGTTITGTGESTTITGLSAGTYAYIVTNSAGCSSASPTANIVINPSTGNPSTPSVGTLTQPTCSVATGSVVINGLPSTGTWTLTRNPDGVTTTGTGASTTISGLIAGNYTFIVTNITGCSSSPTISVVISASTGNPSTPSVGILTQPTCTVATGSVFLSGLPNTGTWTLTRSPDGVTTTGTGTSTTISGLALGTYTYIVTNSLGCTSSPSTAIVLNAASKPVTPIIGTIMQPTCTMPITTVAISGLPATGTWTLTRNPGSVTSTGTGTGTNISGLPAGTYTFTVTNAAACVSVASANVVINTPPTQPAAPLVSTITTPPCDSATGSVVLSGLPATGNWTLNPIGEKGIGTSTTVKKLGEGNYTFTVTNSDGCVSSPSIVVITCKKNMEEKCLNDLVNQIPNGFTPGGNGVNDYFDPEKYLAITGCSNNVKAEELYIVNRWGEIIFKAEPYEKWDGRSSNQQKVAPTSSYYYILVLKVGENRNSIKGVINLFAD